MATFYTIDIYCAIPKINQWSSMGIDEAYIAVSSGQYIWTKEYSDARDLANRFGGGYLDVIHFDIWDRPGEKFTLQHFHPNNTRGHAHICFGNAINDRNPNSILILP